MMQSLSRHSMPTKLPTFDEGYEEEGGRVNGTARDEDPVHFRGPAAAGTAAAEAVADDVADACDTEECNDSAAALATVGTADAGKLMQVLAA